MGRFLNRPYRHNSDSLVGAGVLDSPTVGAKFIGVVEANEAERRRWRIQRGGVMAAVKPPCRQAHSAVWAPQLDRRPLQNHLKRVQNPTAALDSVSPALRTEGNAGRNVVVGRQKGAFRSAFFLFAAGVPNSYRKNTRNSHFFHNSPLTRADLRGIL